MRKRAKMRLAVLGGMIAGAVAGCWLLDVLEAAANWMLVHWMGLDIGKAAARAPALSGLLLCGLFGLGLYLYCRWDETSHRFGLVDASALRSSPIRGAKSRGKIAARRRQRYGKVNRDHARMEEPDYWTNQKDA